MKLLKKNDEICKQKLLSDEDIRIEVKSQLDELYKFKKMGKINFL